MSVCRCVVRTGEREGVGGRVVAAPSLRLDLANDVTTTEEHSGAQTVGEYMMYMMKTREGRTAFWLRWKLVAEFGFAMRQFVCFSSVFSLCACI